MANEFFTLIVVPHAKARFRKIQVPVRFAKWVFGITATIAVVMSGILVHYAQIAVEVNELRRLRAENQALLTKTKEYEVNAGKLQVRLDHLQNMVTKLGVMAGLERSLPDTGGQGGVTGPEAQPPRMEPSALATMELNASQLTTRSAELEAFYKDQTALLASTPSVWPVRGYLSSTFGNRIDPFTGQRDFHPGIDVSTPIGTKIHAPADGVVISAGQHGGYGNAMVVDHGHGIMTRYGHLDGFAVRPGQRIRRGEILGFVGNTGRSTSPHLHYEVWVRDQAQNPIHFILDEYRTFG